MSQCIRLLLLLHLLTLSIVGQAQQSTRESQGVSVSYRAKPLAEVIRAAPVKPNVFVSISGVGEWKLGRWLGKWF